jgi:hypothetical protein
MSSIEQREFIRHPADIPIEYRFVDDPSLIPELMNNVSLGGLSFLAGQYIEPTRWLHIHIPINDQDFELDGQVRWCESSTDDSFYVGVKFADQQQAFLARMVEQICHIEQYKKEVLENEGRKLNSDEAATEWIEKFAKEFPQPN